MARNEDIPDEMVQLVVGCARLGLKQVNAVLNWYAENAKEHSLFRPLSGVTNITTLHRKVNEVKFLPNELDKEKAQALSKEFKKHNVLFAVEKLGDNKYRIALAGKNGESIENAVKQIVKAQDGENGKSRLQDIRDKYREFSEGREGEQKDRERAQERAHENRER